MIGCVVQKLSNKRPAGRTHWPILECTHFSFWVHKKHFAEVFLPSVCRWQSFGWFDCKRRRISLWISVKRRDEAKTGRRWKHRATNRSIRRRVNTNHGEESTRRWRRDIAKSSQGTDQHFSTTKSAREEKCLTEAKRWVETEKPKQNLSNRFVLSPTNRSTMPKLEQRFELNSTSSDWRRSWETIDKAQRHDGSKDDNTRRCSSLDTSAERRETNWTRKLLSERFHSVDRRTNFDRFVNTTFPSHEDGQRRKGKPFVVDHRGNRGKALTKRHSTSPLSCEGSEDDQEFEHKSRGNTPMIERRNQRRANRRRATTNFIEQMLPSKSSLLFSSLLFDHDWINVNDNGEMDNIVDRFIPMIHRVGSTNESIIGGNARQTCLVSGWNPKRRMRTFSSCVTIRGEWGEKERWRWSRSTAPSWSWFERKATLATHLLSSRAAWQSTQALTEILANINTHWQVFLDLFAIKTKDHRYDQLFPITTLTSQSQVVLLLMHKFGERRGRRTNRWVIENHSHRNFFVPFLSIPFVSLSRCVVAFVCPLDRWMSNLLNRSDVSKSKGERSKLMDELSANDWDWDEPSTTMGTTMASFPRLNIDALELVPTTIPEKRKERANRIFCGHVEEGKSTISGQILSVQGLREKIEDWFSCFWSWTLGITTKKNVNVTKLFKLNVYVVRHFEETFDHCRCTWTSVWRVEHDWSWKFCFVCRLTRWENVGRSLRVHWSHFDTTEEIRIRGQKNLNFGFWANSTGKSCASSIRIRIRYLMVDRLSRRQFFRSHFVFLSLTDSTFVFCRSIELSSCSPLEWNGRDQCVLMNNWIPTGIENIFDDEVQIRSSTSGDNIRLGLKNLDEELRFHSTDKTKRTLPFLSLSLRDRFFVVLTKKFLRLEKCSKLK